MMLAALIGIPLAGAILAWLAERVHAQAPRYVALLTLAVGLVIASSFAGASPGPWLADLTLPWIPRFGIQFQLALDGVSLILVMLTFILGLAAVSASWSEIRERVGFFHFMLLLTLTGIIGVFLALDLFLFFVFWEVMLVPMYFLIALWGHEQRLFAAFKFFIFTQASGLLLLVAILALAIAHWRATGAPSFDYFDLLGTPLGAGGPWIFAGFFIAFVVKLPAVPLHTWLPDAHTQASTGGSVILAGILLKAGAYGLWRFAIPLFPDSAAAFTPAALALGVAGILYGAVVAFAQNDIKRLVAYTSVSHMGFVLVGLFAGSALALQGAVLQMVAHGISTGALFMIAGSLQERLHSRDLARMGGLADPLPRVAALGLFFALGALGLPGLGNFVAEFLVLLGTFRVSIPTAVFAALGLVLAAAYALILVQRAFHGERSVATGEVRDYGLRETGTLVVLAVLLLGLGLYPQPLIDVAQPALAALPATAPAVALGAAE